MDKGAGLSVGGISKIASSNKKITLRNWYSGVRFFHCLCLFMWPKGFPSDRSVCGKAFFCLQFASIREYWQPPSALLQHSNPAPPQTKNRSKRNLPKHTVSKEFSRFLVAQQTDTGASIFASMLGVTDAFSYQH